VRSDLERVLRDVTLTTLALAIALGWSLYETVYGLAYFITTLLQRFSPSELAGGGSLGDLSWPVGNHVLAFGPLLRGLIEVSVVLVVVAFVRRYVSARPR
jgi:hypothetical protein